MLRREILFVAVILICSAFNNGEMGNLMYYKGTIGADVKIQMNFELEDSGALKGSYIVDKTGELFVLDGRIDENTQFLSFIVYNQREEHIATIEAIYYIDPQQEMQDIEGFWKPMDDTTIKRIKLVKLAEIIA